MTTADEIIRQLLELEATPPLSPSSIEEDRDLPPGPSLTDTLHDLYHAKEIIRFHGNDIRYCRKLGGFLIWDGTRWTLNETGKIWRLAIRTASDVFAEELDRPGGPNPDVQRWALRSLRHSNLSNAIKQLELQPEVVAAPDAFDSDPWLLNVENGTIDLHTGDIREHRREDLITHCAPVKFNPDAGPPKRWLQFLSEIFDGNKNMIDFVQCISGYTLTGSVSEQKFFLLHGSKGDNGKTTFLNTLMYVMGEYAVRLAPELLFNARRNIHPSAFAELRGRRLAGIAEVEFGSKLAEVLVKKLTGRDPLTARRARTDYLRIEPTHKIFICGNHLPAIRATSHAIWRRILLIPFTVTIPEERQDIDLPAKFRAEASGILNWLLQGCLQWQKSGLKQPAEVAEAIRSYRSDMDVLGDFLEDCSVPDPDGEVTNPEMRKAYEEWCQHNGQRPMSARGLALSLKERGFVQKQMGPSRTRTWLGIALQPYEEPLTEDQLRQLEEMAEKIERLYHERENKSKS
jgi:putative DNA primase/helicase